MPQSPPPSDAARQEAVGKHRRLGLGDRTDNEAAKHFWDRLSHPNRSLIYGTFIFAKSLPEKKPDHKSRELLGKAPNDGIFPALIVDEFLEFLEGKLAGNPEYDNVDLLRDVMARVAGGWEGSWAQEDCP